MFRSRVFFCILKEISIRDKNGEFSRSIEPVSLRDGTYIALDEIEFFNGVVSLVRDSLINSKKKKHKEKDILRFIRNALYAKTNEVKNLTVRIP